jgi:probable phosphoglycerate mutase
MDAAAKGLTWHPTGVSPPVRDTLPASAPDFPAARNGTHPGNGAAPAGQATLFGSMDPAITGAPEAGVTSIGTGWRQGTTNATVLLLLRHGETPLSVERRFSGIGDPELTANGVAQAEAAAARLSGKPYQVDVIVTSPLKRARTTAEIVAGRTGAPVTVDERLRETDFGDWEGHTFTEIQRRWPEELTAWLADPAVSPPQGESFAVVARRLQAVRERLVSEHAGKTVLVVSHVTPIKMLLRFALTAPPTALYRMHLDLSSLSVIEYYEDGPAVVKAFNDTAHLR